MNVLNIIGNLTRDPESRQVGDKTVCNFTVAVNRRQKDKDGNNVADFFRISAWGKMGENCQKYLNKGRKVGVTGSVSVHPFLGQDGSPKASLEVFASEVEFLNSGNGGEQSQSAQVADAPATDPSGGTPVDTDELPFDSGLVYP